MHHLLLAYPIIKESIRKETIIICNNEAGFVPLYPSFFLFHHKASLVKMCD
jgi:hypothetical protein